MIHKLMKQYAVSEKGAKDLILSVVATVCVNLALMLPVGLLYVLVSDLLAGQPKAHLTLLIVGSIAALVLIGLTVLWQYNATFFAMYQESGVKRLALTEKLRRLPLSFFGKKDSADLTTVIWAMSQHWSTLCRINSRNSMVQLYRQILIAIGLLFFEWRMALAALWPLPISLIIVALSKSIRHRLSVDATQARLTAADGMQECLEASKDLQSANAEQTYLHGLYQKIESVEVSSTRAELITGMLVTSAQMLLKFGIATVALVGGYLLVQGKIDLIVFFAFLLVVSRFTSR